MGEKVISMQAYLRKRRKCLTREKLYALPKEKLLQELIRYYEDITQDPFDIETVLWGEDLMEVIAEKALTKELHTLAERYLSTGLQSFFELQKN